MRKIIRVFLIGVLFILVLSSCSNTPQPPASNPEQGSETPTPGTPFFRYHYYSSVEELYQGLSDFPQERLNSLQS